VTGHVRSAIEAEGTVCIVDALHTFLLISGASGEGILTVNIIKTLNTHILRNGASGEAPVLGPTVGIQKANTSGRGSTWGSDADEVLFDITVSLGSFFISTPLGNWAILVAETFHTATTMGLAPRVAAIGTVDIEGAEIYTNTGHRITVGINGGGSRRSVELGAISIHGPAVIT